MRRRTLSSISSSRSSNSSPPDVVDKTLLSSPLRELPPLATSLYSLPSEHGISPSRLRCDRACPSGYLAVLQRSFCWAGRHLASWEGRPLFVALECGRSHVTSKSAKSMALMARSGPMFIPMASRSQKRLSSLSGACNAGRSKQSSPQSSSRLLLTGF